MIARLFRKIKTTIFKLLNWNIFSESVLYEIPKVYYKKRLKLGKRIHINDNVFIHAVGGVNIGDDSVLSHGVSIISTGLKIQDWQYRDIHKDQHEHNQIIIGKNVWLAANVTICSGVNIANNSVVAAGAVVVNDLDEENCLYGGIPAKKIRNL